MSDPAPDRLADVRKLYNLALDGKALDGSAIYRWRYFDREDVGMLLARVGDLEVLLAWESGELSEGQANQLLAASSGGTTDPVTVRGMRMAAIAAARERWEKWRACNPPSPG